MPELPEVETLCRQLQAKIAGKHILGSIVYDDKLSGLANVVGCKIEAVRRDGKAIALRLDGERYIKIHLRMTGRLLWRPCGEREPHTRWRISLENGNIDLVDPRRFATVRVQDESTGSPEKDLFMCFDEKEFLRRQAIRRISVKILLMDQRAIAGIGNIYACEILHSAGISPLRQVSTLSLEEWKRVFRYGRRILKSAIRRRGTSISDWRDLYGCPGEYQQELKVYGRKGKACCTCGACVARIRQGGRSTFYCPECQE
jgi:formamidopyrimidine-DNA glycosylase